VRFGGENTIPNLMRPALFLDRDGVINVNRGYVHKQEDFEFIDGIFELCRQARQLGFAIFVVTNQSGIGRGYYTEQDFSKLTDWMCGVFKEHGVDIEKVYYCPSRPDENSPDRKPMPGMILRAAEEFGIDLSRSVLVGDKDTDIQAGILAGVGLNFLYSP
jgi:D-glycero-D-manno-heptose 1,7-bisphosphate phosphatase